MSQQINDNYQLLAGLPLDDRSKKATIADRDAISSTRRYQGLLCFVEQTQTLYQLTGGISNSNWMSNVFSSLETVIEGFYVLSAGKETLLDWEVGDKFRGWIASRYVVGEILSLPVSLPSDIDNVLKVSLALDSDSINAKVPKIQFIADGSTDTFDIGVNAQITAVAISGVIWNDDDWSQTGSSFTFTFTPDLNAIIKPI